MTNNGIWMVYICFSKKIMNVHKDFCRVFRLFEHIIFTMLPKNDGGFSCVNPHVFGRREPPVQLKLV